MLANGHSKIRMLNFEGVAKKAVVKLETKEFAEIVFVMYNAIS